MAPESDCPHAEAGRLLVQSHLRPDHCVLRVLLHGDCFQSDGYRRQHAQERRLHSGYPSGKEYLRLYREGAYANHPPGGDFLRGHRGIALGADFAVQRELFLRRYRTADCGRCRAGYFAAD